MERNLHWELSWLPQLPQLVSAGCCEQLTWWSYLSTPDVICSFIWKPHQRRHSALPGTLHGVLQLATLKVLPQEVTAWDFECLIQWSLSVSSSPSPSPPSPTPSSPIPLPPPLHPSPLFSPLPSVLLSPSILWFLLLSWFSISRNHWRTH